MNNSLYGAITQNSFRYYILAIGEAITLSGQASNRHLELHLNKYFNKILKTDDIDYVAYSDTDSNYINFDSIVNKLCKDKSDTINIVEFLEKLALKLQDTVIKESTDHIFNLCNCFENLMSYKIDTVSEKAIWTSKKRYCMIVHSAELVRYHPPKLKIMGMDIIKSSTPKAIRAELKSCLPIIFNKGEIALREFVTSVKDRFYSLPVSDIAFPRGTNDIEKWMDGNGYKIRVPVHVRGSINYNNLTTSFPKYDKIRSGDKIKYVYLKIPNTIKENVISFPTSKTLPLEFGLEKYIDKELQFEKAFLNPLEAITNAIGWQLEEKSDLSEFFC